MLFPSVYTLDSVLTFPLWIYSKMYYIVSYLQGAAVPEETPNAETLDAMAEVEEMIKTGSGQ